MMDPMIQDMLTEIERLKVVVASTPRAFPAPAMKGVTPVAGIKDWTVDNKGRKVHEFFHKSIHMP
jgi:hypothetical protein